MINLQPSVHIALYSNKAAQVGSAIGPIYNKRGGGRVGGTCHTQREKYVSVGISHLVTIRFTIQSSELAAHLLFITYFLV